MAPRSRGGALLLEAISNPNPVIRSAQTTRPYVCNSCRTSIWQQRHASTAAAQATIQTPPISQVSPDEPATGPDAQPQVTIKAGIVVSRPPLLTPEAHPFDTAFHLYQRRLNERLVLPFTQYFHFKRGTPAFERWRTKRRERNGVAARDLGNYNAYSRTENWNDEVLVGDECAKPQNLLQKLIEEEGRGEEFGPASEDAAKVAGLKRTTDADTNSKTKSLDRKLDRTLYLLVRGKQSKDEKAWRFPSGDVVGKEVLKDAAQRVLEDSCGVNMNTWIVAPHPIGHCVEPTKDTEQKGNKSTDPDTSASDATYFIKARIFAGQADIKGNAYELEDFIWLAKEEIEQHVSPEYWASVKNMLVEQ